MNVAIILSGGCGKRFGAALPKQYLELCGKRVINYVIEATLEAKEVDEIVLVRDSQYDELIQINEGMHLVSNGQERLDSIKNALDYIEEQLPECEKIIIVQAVSPFITKDLIDNYMELLEEYDVVTTAEKCVGEVFNKNKFQRMNRNEFYFCQSPEAFWFDELYQNLDVQSEYSELIYHYPEEPKIFFYLDFTNNVKLTYASDLEYAEFLMKRCEK